MSVLIYIRELRQKIIAWKSMSPKQKWQIVYNVGNFFCELLGLKVFGDLKNYWYTGVTGLGLIIYVITSTYAFVYYYYRGETMRGTVSFCVVGPVSLGSLKYWTVAGPKRSVLNKLLNFSGQYIYNDMDRSPKYRELCKQQISKLIRSVVLVVLLIIVSHILEKRYVTFIGTVIPFTDPDSYVGWMLNLSLQLLLVLTAFIGNVAIEIMICLENHTVSTIPEVISYDLEELTDELKMNGNNGKTRAQLRNIMMKIQDFDRYIKEMIDIYYLKLFLVPFLFTFSISYSIFLQITFDVPTGYGCAMFCYNHLLIVCNMGQVVNDANERLAEVIYDMPWYLLPITEQKYILTAIHQLQNGAKLTIGPLSEINFETVSSLTKIIFNYTMVLIRLQEENFNTLASLKEMFTSFYFFLLEQFTTSPYSSLFEPFFDKTV